MNVGVLAFHNISVVIDYFARLKIATINPGAYDYSTHYYDFETGLRVPGFVPASDAEVGAAIESYINILATKYSYLQTGYFFPDPVPEELLIPFGEFVNIHGLRALMPVLNLLLQNIGNLWEVPTVQVLKSCDISLAQSILDGLLSVASGDTQDIYTSATQALGEYVLYNSEAVQVDRSLPGEVYLVVQTPNGKQIVKVRRLIVTIPPLLDTLRGFDLSCDESSVFSKFKSRGYYGAIFKHSGISEKESYTNIGTHTPFHLETQPGMFMIAPLGLPRKHIAYLETLDASVSSQQAQDLMVKQINTLQSKGVFPADKTEFLYFTNHAPSRLYVTAEDIRDGFYRDLYGLQGHHDTFWTGAAWITPDSALIWNFTETQVLPAVVHSLQG